MSRRSSLFGLSQEIRSQIELLWQERRASLDELVDIAGGKISRSSLCRYLEREASSRAYVYRLSFALLRRISEKLLASPGNDLDVVDIARLGETLVSLDSIVNRPEPAAKKRGGEKGRSRERK
jgi:hypothetical protein